MQGDIQKFIFLYLKTGGGHFAPARSLAKYIEKKHPGVASILVNGFEKTPWLIKYLIEDGYRKLQAGATWGYELLYASHKIHAISWVSSTIISFFSRKYIEEVILKEKPDKIIILHFFLIKPVYYVLKKHKLNIKIFTIVTDPFTAHPLWFHEKNQNYIVFSQRLKNKIEGKVEAAGINVFPFILDEKFSGGGGDKSPAEISALKIKYGFPIDKKIILVLGGGDGIPHGEKILHELLSADLNASIAIVCGKNEKLCSTASELKKEYNKEDFIVYGFVDFVYELLSVADVIVTKCGASTMMEILMMEKIPVVNDYIWEQEKGNIEFIRDNKFGIYEPVIKKLPDVLRNLINDDAVYNSYKNNIINAGLKNGTAEVGEFIVSE